MFQACKTNSDCACGRNLICQKAGTKVSICMADHTLHTKLKTQWDGQREMLVNFCISYKMKNRIVYVFYAVSELKHWNFNEKGNIYEEFNHERVSRISFS